MTRTSKKLKITNNSKVFLKRSAIKRVNSDIYGALEYPVHKTVLLYKLVFLSKKAVLLSILLCVSFFLQPFDRVSAQELGEQASPEVVVVEAELDDTVPPEEILNEPSEDELITQMVTPENNTESEEASTVEPEIEVDTEAESAVDTQEEELQELPADTTESDAPVEAGSEVATTSQNTTDTTVDDIDTTPTVIPEIEQEREDTDSSSDSGGDRETDTEENSLTASTSDSDLVITAGDEPPGEFVSKVSSDSQFTFTKNECTQIDDGSYYCQNKTDTIELDDSLIAAPDADGDLEIFLVRGGERFQLTHNTVDDASPHYDEYSQTIVWHRLLDDRYQIMTYDIESGEESQLTDTSVNNMEPARHGDYTVWQRWVENNWEIMLHDGQVEKQITSSARHDIAPHVRGPLVIWNSQSNDGTQELKTYDIQNRTFNTIADGDGVSVTNPRMVVVYEAVYENGDIVTKGYDLISGEIVPLESLPRKLPDKLPDTDSTGETRALIQQKNENTDVEVSEESPDQPILTATSTAQETENTLDLRPLATSSEAVLISEIAPEVADIPDLVIPIAEPTTTAATSTQ